MKFSPLPALAALLLSPVTAHAQTPDAGTDPKELVREAWQAVDEGYYDPEFGGADWSAIGEEYLSRSYGSVEAAHAAIREMLAKLDNPATRFLEPDQAAALQAEFAGDLGEGVGLMELLSVDTNEETGEIVVVTPVPGTPAARAGLRTGDVILAVDGRSTREMDLAATMSALRGPAGAPVRVSFSRDGETHEISIEREAVEPVVPVESDVREVDGTTIGYLGLRGFSQAAPEPFLDAVRSMEERDVDGYVLDLRNNPGGYVPVLRGIAGAFLGDAALVSLETRGGVQTVTGTGERLTDAPVVALINEGTASAAEALAAALQHHDRAVILGVRSFGKGFAHGFTQLSDGSAVMPTIGRLVTLDGVDILEHGVGPDVEVRAAVHPVVHPEVEVGGPDDVQFRAAVERLK